jgi:D-Ala-D-Ala ligase-like protein
LTLIKFLLVSSVEVIPPKANNGIRILGEKVVESHPEGLKLIDDNMVMDRVKKLAIDVYMDLGIRDYGRVDIKSNKSGQCYFMEANLVPGMTNGTSYFPKAFEMELGLSYEEVIELIVDEGIILKKGLLMAKTNYSYEKRAREIEKQKKKEEKRKKKQIQHDDETQEGTQTPSDASNT